MDRFIDKDRGVVDDAIVYALREALLEARHFCFDPVGRSQGVGARQLEHGEHNGGFAVQVAIDVGVFGAEFDVPHISDPRDLAVVPRLDDDLGELLGLEQAAQGVDGILEIDARGHRRLADASGRHLHILLVQRVHDIARHHAARGQLLRVKPHAHAVIARPQERHVADAGEPGEGVLHLNGGVVAQIERITAVLGRDQIDGEQDAGGFLLGRDPLAFDFLGQLGLGNRDAILRQHLGVVDVGPEFEGHVEIELTVIGALGEHVQHVLDAVDFLFDRRRDRVGYHLGAGARVEGRDLHHRRRDLRVLRHRQGEEGHPADDDDDNRDDCGKDGAIDKET